MLAIFILIIITTTTIFSMSQLGVHGLLLQQQETTTKKHLCESEQQLPAAANGSIRFSAFAISLDGKTLTMYETYLGHLLLSYRYQVSIADITPTSMRLPPATRTNYKGPLRITAETKLGVYEFGNGLTVSLTKEKIFLRAPLDESSSSKNDWTIGLVRPVNLTIVHDRDVAQHDSRGWVLSQGKKRLN